MPPREFTACQDYYCAPDFELMVAEVGKASRVREDVTRADVQLRPMPVKTAMLVAAKVHRKLPRVVGGMWAIALVVGGTVRGVAIVGRPVARTLDARSGEPQEYLEVNRVAVPEGLTVGGHGGPISMLYGACARAARAMGARGLLTYTHESEPGTTLRAAGWVRELDGDGQPRLFGGGQWSRPSRQRKHAADAERRHRWWTKWSEIPGS